MGIHGRTACAALASRIRPANPRARFRSHCHRIARHCRHRRRTVSRKSSRRARTHRSAAQRVARHGSRRHRTIHRRTEVQSPPDHAHHVGHGLGNCDSRAAHRLRQRIRPCHRHHLLQFRHPRHRMLPVEDHTAGGRRQSRRVRPARRRRRGQDHELRPGRQAHHARSRGSSARPIRQPHLHAHHQRRLCQYRRDPQARYGSRHVLHRRRQHPESARRRARLRSA